MNRIAGALVIVLATSSCATYTVYSKAYGDGPNRETFGILLGAEAAVGAVVATGTAISWRGKGDWYENAFIGFIVPFVVDLAIAFGVGTSDLVGE